MCMMLHGMMGVFLYRLGGGRFARILGNVPHATAFPSIECTAWSRCVRAELGAVCSHCRCGRTMGHPTRHRLALVGCWLGLDASHTGILAWSWSLVGLLHMFCLNTPSWLRSLVNFHTCAYKTCIYQNSWKMWVVNPNSKFWHSYLFYFVEMLAVEMWVKHHQQAPPHLVLCSSSSKVLRTKRVHLLDLKTCIQVIPSFTWTCELPSVYQNILGNWKMEQLRFKSSHSIPAQKLGFLYYFLKHKDSFCSLNDSLGSLKFVSGSSPRHILKFCLLFWSSYF